MRLLTGRVRPTEVDRVGRPHVVSYRPEVSEKIASNTTLPAVAQNRRYPRSGRYSSTEARVLPFESIGVAGRIPEAKDLNRAPFFVDCETIQYCVRRPMRNR